MIRTRFKHLRVQIQIKLIRLDDPRLLHGPQLHGIQKYTAISGRTHEHRKRHAMTCGQQTLGHSIVFFLRCEMGPQPIAKFGAGHLTLKFRKQQDRCQETILIKQHVFVKRHIRYSNRTFVAQRTIIAPDWNLVNRAFAMRVQTAMAVVIAHRIGCRKIRDPARFKQRNQPSLMLSRYRHRPSNRHGERTAKSDGVIKNGIDTA